MGKRQEYTCVSYVRMPDGSLVEFASLTPEQKQVVRDRMCERVSNALSDFLTAHPEVVEQLRHCESVHFE